MPKFIYSIANSDGEDCGELEIEARNSDEAWEKKKAAEKSGKYLKPGEYIHEWRESPGDPTGVKRR
jgi:hypothetical protein